MKVAWKERLLVVRNYVLCDYPTYARLTVEQNIWLEKQVKEGKFESKAHAIRQAVKLLQKERELPK